MNWFKFYGLGLYAKRGYKSFPVESLQTGCKRVRGILLMAEVKEVVGVRGVAFSRSLGFFEFTTRGFSLTRIRAETSLVSGPKLLY